MADDKDTKYVPKCRIVLGTQEEATALNNGEATQIVLNRRVRSPTDNKSKPRSQVLSTLI